MSFVVYILECADKTLYVGSTNDLHRRLHQHNTAKAGAHYTKIRRPVTLKYFEEYETKSESLKREAILKKLSRTAKLELIAVLDTRKLDDYVQCSNTK